MKHAKSIGFATLILVWAALAAFCWFAPAKESSESERRPLAQMPQIQGETILNGKFMGEFEDYTLDQFPLRETFRQVKSLFHYNVLGQLDNNGIYLADGFAVKQEYPLNVTSVKHAMERLNHIYDRCLKDAGSAVFMAVVPDKGCYLAEPSGHLTLDYDALQETVRLSMPWASHVELADCLDAGDYYRTDTHWRQEEITGVAQRLCDALGVTSFEDGDLTCEMLERPFYGVYYGQAALPMDPEPMYVLRGEIIDGCTVYDHETGKTGTIYDMTKLDSRDLYDVYLSGARALLTIENPNAATDRELIVFRDSFGSSLIPLLVKDYASVTVVDIRYVSSNLLDNFVDFHGQDVLFLYSTLILNSSNSLK